MHHPPAFKTSPKPSSYNPKKMAAKSSPNSKPFNIDE